MSPKFSQIYSGILVFLVEEKNYNSATINICLKIDSGDCKQIASIEHHKTRFIRVAIEIGKIGRLNKKDNA